MNQRKATKDEAIRELIEQARAGKQESLPRLRALLDERSEVWERAGDLGQYAIDNFTTAIAGGDLLFQESLRRKLRSQALRLAGRRPSPLIELLAERAALAWLRLTHSENMIAASADSTPTQLRFLEERHSAVQRAFHTAVQAIATVRKLETPTASQKGSFSSASQRRKRLV